jgi:hypothetical protein
MEAIGYPKMSVRNYHSFRLRKIPEERRSHLHRSGSLLSAGNEIFQRLVDFFLYVYFQSRTDKISLGATALGKRLRYLYL